MKINSYKVLYISVSIVYVLFGVLKIFDMSPIKDLVTSALPFMENVLLFSLFGLIEVVIGLMLIFSKTRKLASILLILHILGTLSTFILSPNILLTNQLIPTLHGEFVLKNIIILAVGYYIFDKERNS